MREVNMTTLRKDLNVGQIFDEVLQKYRREYSSSGLIACTRNVNKKFKTSREGAM